MKKKIRISGIFLILVMTVGALSAEELTMGKCIDLALKNNISVQSGELSNRLSQSQTTQAYGRLLPSVTASAGLSANDATSWDPGQTAGISAGLTLYTPGLYSGLKTAKLSEAVSLETARQNELDVVGQVRSMYFKILNTKELMDVYKENIAVAEENLKRTRQMYELGNITESDVLKSEVQKGDFESQWLNYKQLYLSYVRSLNVLMGRHALDDLSVLPVDVEQIEIPEYAAAYDQMLENNPYIRSLKYNQDVSKVALTASKTSYLPTVSASYGYSYNSEAIGSKTGQSAGLSASWTLFNGLNRRETVQQKRIAVEQAELSVEETVLNFEKMLTDYYTQYEIYSELIQINKKRLSSAKRDFEIVNQQYRIGNVTILDRMQAQISVLSAESALSEALYSRILLESEINKLINK